MAVTVRLSRGMFALVDDSDAERVLAHKWSVFVAQNGTPYAVRVVAKKSVYLHRWLMGAGQGQKVDHRSGDTLDCRRENMRLCTQAENNRNRRPCGIRTLKGIRARPNGRWIAVIGANGGTIHLGTFDTPEAAARAYDAAALKFHGEFARLNFGDAA